jgi:acetyltransferase-like isoleucine patch superfamily enzyme
MSLLFNALNRLVIEYQKIKIYKLKSRLQFCGKNVYISSQSVIWSESCLSIEDDVCIHAFTHIFAGGGLSIGKGTMISSNCSITTVTHTVDSLKRTQGVYESVDIGQNVWIGTGAVILPGVSIGNYSVIGAGAVVTKDIPPMQVVVGNPAKFLKNVELDRHTSAG